MTALNAITAGARITAAAVQGVAPLAAYKGASQSVTNSATLVNDTDLFLPLAASAFYYFTGMFTYTAAAGNGDLQAAFTVPSGTTIQWTAIHYDVTGAFGMNIATASGQVLVFYGGSPVGALFQGSIITGTTAGNLQLKWAQRTANSSTPTVLQAGSAIIGWQIG